jgi:hypothetical protein
VLQLIQFGNSFFSALLSPNHGDFVDPVNLQFVGLTASQAASILTRDEYRPWNPTRITGPMDAYFDGRAGGGFEGWEKPKQVLELVYPGQKHNPWGMRTPRLHLRIYGSPTQDPTHGNWCIANVHLEHVGPATHLVHGWNDPSDFVAERLRALTDGTSYNVESPSGGLYHGVTFDGAIRVVSVPVTPYSVTPGHFKL